MKEEGTAPAQAGGNTSASLGSGARKQKGLRGWRSWRCQAGPRPLLPHLGKGKRGGGRGKGRGGDKCPEGWSGSKHQSKGPWGGCVCVSCPEVLITCLGLGWEPVNCSLYLLCLNWSCHSQSNQLTASFPSGKIPPGRTPESVVGCCNGQGQPLGPTHEKESGTPL